MEAKLEYCGDYIAIRDFCHSIDDEKNGNPYNCSFDIMVKSGVFTGIADGCEYDYKECSVRAIQTVKTKHVYRAGTFIFLVDDHTPSYKKFFPTRKDSYICFRKNKKNLAFLHTFWSGEVEK